MSITKKYVKVSGDCKECCLYSECSKNKTQIIKFLEKLGLYNCGSGDCIKVESNVEEN